tara:strand:- start:34590 stop:35261 length:672 start_codon:yes stop_codon:yes gene_type:complete
MDFNKVLSGLTSSGVLGGVAGGMLGGALVSKKGRKHAGTLLKVGGVAALGGVAWKAYKGYQASNAGPGQPAVAAQAATSGAAPALQAAPAPQWQGLREADFTIEASDTSNDSRALLLVQAMIAAACSDGHLDGQERARIMAEVEQLGLAPDEKALVFDSLQNPMSLADLSQRIQCPELAVEVYSSSLLAVDTTRSEARLYLDALAFRLGMPQELATRLEQELA